MKVDQKRNKLIYTESEMTALLLNLFRGYNRVFGGVSTFEQSYEYFLNRMNERSWFAKLSEKQKAAFIIFVMNEFKKGFTDE